VIVGFTAVPLQCVDKQEAHAFDLANGLPYLATTIAIAASVVCAQVGLAISAGPQPSYSNTPESRQKAVIVQESEVSIDAR
jgi:hypothetical protein